MADGGEMGEWGGLWGALGPSTTGAPEGERLGRSRHAFPPTPPAFTRFLTAVLSCQRLLVIAPGLQRQLMLMTFASNVQLCMT